MKKAGISVFSVFACVFWGACAAGGPTEPASASDGLGDAGTGGDKGSDGTPVGTADAGDGASSPPGDGGTADSADAGSNSPTPPVDTTDAGPIGPPPPPAEDEAGDLQNPLDVVLPFSIETDLRPEGDTDCFRFAVTESGLFRAETGNVASSTCSGGDTKLYLYTDGTTSTANAIAVDDDSGDGACSLLELTLDVGSYVICNQHYSSFAPSIIYGATLELSFTPYVCGNGEIDPGEECDGAVDCENCILNDGLLRENETAGNDLPSGPGVQQLELNVPVRGRVTSATDVDWWRLELPGGFQPGAVVVHLGSFDIESDVCETESLDLRLEAFSADDFGTPQAESFAEEPCRELIVTSLNEDILFGDETLFIRVRTQNRKGPYHLIAEYIEGDCGNGEIEPSEQCDPAATDFVDSCDPMLCRWTPPPNDSCAAALDISDRLPAVGERTMITGQTFSATSSTSWTGSGSCQSSAVTTHQDVHYTFVAPIDGVLVADLNTTWDAVLYLMEGACETAVECSDPGLLETSVIAGQQYTLVVDAYSSGLGEFELELELVPSPENDRCESATDLTDSIPLDGSVYVARGNTVSAANDADWPESGCDANNADAREVFYAFTAQQDGQVFVSLNSENWDAVLYALEEDCTTGIECSDTPEELLLDVVAGDSYIVVVDGWTTSSRGEFELQLSYALPPPNDLCGAEEALAVPDTGAKVEVYGSTTFASDDAEAAMCSQGSTAHRDTFHAFTSPGTGELVIQAVGNGWTPMIYARTSCDAADELDCATNPADLAVPVADGEVIYVGVDAYGSAKGSYTLSAQFRVPPPFIPGADTCVDATPLPSISGTLRGTLDNAEPDYDSDDLGECTNGFASEGPDVVYSVELTQGQRLRVEYTAVESGTDESLLLLNACPPVSDSCVDGSDNAYAGPEVVDYTHQSATPKIYFIVVDEYGFSSWSQGAFELTWEIIGPAN